MGKNCILTADFAGRIGRYHVHKQAEYIEHAHPKTLTASGSKDFIVCLTKPRENLW